MDHARIIESEALLKRGNLCREPTHDTYIPSTPSPHTADLCMHWQQTVARMRSTAKFGAHGRSNISFCFTLQRWSILTQTKPGK
jgi:hypothetical protein